MLCATFFSCIHINLIFFYLPRNAFGYTIVGFPVRIENSKYFRNALIFNFCFILPLDSNTDSYRPLLTKIASAFTTLEVIQQQSMFHYNYSFASLVLSSCVFIDSPNVHLSPTLPPSPQLKPC